MQKTMRQLLEDYSGRFIQHWTEYYDEECGDEIGPTPLPRTSDVSEAVKQLIREYKVQLGTIKDLQKELSELKTRRWYEEKSMVMDEKTGMMVVVVNRYTMRLDGTRVEFDPTGMYPATAWQENLNKEKK